MKLITANQVSEMLGISVASISQYWRAGILPAPVKFGGAKNSIIRFDEDEVLACVEENKARNARLVEECWFTDKKKEAEGLQ